MARPEGGGGKVVAAAGDTGMVPADGKEKDFATSFTTTGSSNAETESSPVQTSAHAIACPPQHIGENYVPADPASHGTEGEPSAAAESKKPPNVSPAIANEPTSKAKKGMENLEEREVAVKTAGGKGSGVMGDDEAALEPAPTGEGGRREEDTESSTLPEDSPAKETQSAPAALGRVTATNAGARPCCEKEEAEREQPEGCCSPDCACAHGNGEEAVEGENKPVFFSLCTKCAHEGKRGPHARREPVRGLIIRSESFMNASDASRWEVEEHCSSGCSGEAAHHQQQQAGGAGAAGGEAAAAGAAAAAGGAAGTAAGAAQGSSPQHEGPVFDRSRIVHEVLLEGGQQINDIYDIPNGVSLGKGSYGSVVKAKDLKTNMMRAVKVVYKPRIENVTRLKREILIMKRLDHPNIIKLLEVYEDLKNLYLVMELCTGGELFERIIKSGHFSERYAASLMKQIFSAASYCHSQNVIHRDLKPENLLYADSSPLSALKVIDWGFAARCGKSHKFSSVVGTPYYVAPEVLFGKYGSECDMWSAGVILHILLCGYPPFHGKDNQEILKKVQVGEFSFDARHWRRVSDHAKDLVKRCLTYVPGMRITAAEALQHPWIQCYTGTGAGMRLERPISMQLGGDLIERFKAFQRLHKLKKLAITCVAYQLSDADIGTLHDAFAALDTNADGVLTVAELKQGLKQCCVAGDDINEILKEMDTDGNGTIDYTEFIAASIDHKIYEQESACQAAFKVFDLDGDGKITVEELQKILETRYVQEAFSKEAVAEMLKEADANNDGCIDFDEFMRMMRGRQRKVSESNSPLARARALLYRRYDG